MASGEWGVKDTTALIPVIQNVWAPYLTMRHVLLESFVSEEANRVPFLILIREFSYRDPSVFFVFLIGIIAVRVVYSSTTVLVQY